MRLDWVVRNQDRLRLESLQGLMDYLAGAVDTGSVAVEQFPLGE